jgi:competence protein ComEA
MRKFLIAALLSVSSLACLAGVDVNKASAADLDSIKGIGPSTSTKIVEARKTTPFKDWNDLVKRVPGIGEKRAAQLSAQGLTVNGEAYKSAYAPATAKPADRKAADAKTAPATSASR